MPFPKISSNLNLIIIICDNFNIITNCYLFIAIIYSIIIKLQLSKYTIILQTENTDIKKLQITLNVARIILVTFSLGHSLKISDNIGMTLNLQKRMKINKCFNNICQKNRTDKTFYSIEKKLMQVIQVQVIKIKHGYL